MGLGAGLLAAITGSVLILASSPEPEGTTAARAAWRARPLAAIGERALAFGLRLDF